MYQLNCLLLLYRTRKHKPDGTFKYMIAAELPNDSNVQSFEVFEIPKMTWAVFIERCPLKDELTPLVQSIWKRIPEWLETAGFEYAEAPSLERFEFSDYLQDG
ncbi:MAG: GyrI-like domain-containing protein [Ruminiclostridium sp.]